MFEKKNFLSKNLFLLLKLFSQNFKAYIVVVRNVQPLLKCLPNEKL